MKKKKLEKKKRKHVRVRDWASSHETAFSHDRARHRRALVSLPTASADAESPIPHVPPNALVVSHAKKWAFVLHEGTERLCIIDERLKEENATLLAPGDRVGIERDEEQWVVRTVGPRTTKLSRPAGPHDRVDEQLFATNVDVLLIVTAAEDPPFRVGLVDRYLIAAEVGGVEPILCVNKMDLVNTEPQELHVYRELGIQVFTTSCVRGDGIEPLRKALQGKVTVLSGHSGVGKSTLLNTMDPHLAVYTQGMSSTHRGKHSTTLSRLYVLDGEITIIDTPGIRALGLWKVTAEELAFYFPELAEAAERCQFRDCTHTHEPRCAVREAVETGQLAKERYASYLRIRASLQSEKNMTPGRLAPIHRLSPEDRK